ncbi:hypothetical protein [Nostoc sp.]
MSTRSKVAIAASSRGKSVYSVVYRRRHRLIKWELNSTNLSPDPLVFRTVRKTFTLHGSSLIWLLL